MVLKSNEDNERFLRLSENRCKLIGIVTTCTKKQQKRQKKTKIYEIKQRYEPKLKNTLVINADQDVYDADVDEDDAEETEEIVQRKIPRPANAFMLFANEWRKKLAVENPGESNKDISVRLEFYFFYFFYI